MGPRIWELMGSRLLLIVWLVKFNFHSLSKKLRIKSTCSFGALLLDFNDV